MVCHESYKDINGDWLYPEEVEKINSNTVLKKSDKSKVVVGPAESMSKSKKNTIDPEVMINQYGADAVRLFILSDSPPEKDVQWSNTGVASANKFLQKIWNLNCLISARKEKEAQKEEEKKFILGVNSFLNKIDNSIKNFRFNVSIALFYEVYKFLRDYLEKEISNKVLKESAMNLIKQMIPLTPHFAHECLELMNCINVNTWPEISENKFEEIKLPVQINGKTRDIISIQENTTENDIKKIILKQSKAKKYIENKKIIKTIFVKNKIINYII